MAKERAGRRKKQGEQAPVRHSGETHFLGIGINTYTQWPRLGNAVSDVKAIAELLVNDFGIHSTTLLLDEQATRGNILHALENLADTLGDAHNLIIYYAGHGHLNQRRNRGYWVPIDAVPGQIDQLINNAVIKEYIKDIPTRHTLLISDACFSGSLFIRGERSESLPVEELIELPSRWAICSGRHDETVADGPKDGHSPFAKSILDVLQRTPRPAITTNFLYEQVREQTRSNYKQMPDGGPLQFAGHERGEYVFVRTLDEAGIWADAKSANTIAAYEAYLVQCPEGKHVVEAQTAIASLKLTQEWLRLETLPDETLAQASSKSRQLLQFCKQQKGNPYYDKALALGIDMDAKRDYLQAYHSAFQLMAFIERDTPYREAAQERLAELEEPKETFQKKRTPSSLPPKKSKQRPAAKQPGKLVDLFLKKETVSKTSQQSRTPKQNEPFKSQKLPPRQRSKWKLRVIMGLGVIALLVFVSYQYNKYTQSQQSDPTNEPNTNNSIDDPEEAARRARKKAADQSTSEIGGGFSSSTGNSTESSSPDRNTASIANNMVRVSGGTYTMGCQDGRDTNCLDREKPAHNVTLSTFYISKYEVTQAQWKAVMGENPSGFSDCGNQCPVEKVSWDDVQIFLQKLNASTDKNYRLPTEAEWEYAVRGGNQSKDYFYSGSNSLDKVAWYETNSGKRTHPVGQKSPNELGLYDMDGNVWEWCNDWYGSYNATTQTNPRGSSSSDSRVLRGGSWVDYAASARCAFRGYAASGSRNRRNNIGFRLARD